MQIVVDKQFQRMLLRNVIIEVVESCARFNVLVLIFFFFHISRFYIDMQKKKKRYRCFFFFFLHFNKYRKNEKRMLAAHVNLL